MSLIDRWVTGRGGKVREKVTYLVLGHRYDLVMRSEAAVTASGIAGGRSSDLQGDEKSESKSTT